MKIILAYSSLTYPPIDGKHVQSLKLLKYLIKAGLDCYVIFFKRADVEFDRESFLRDYKGIKSFEQIETKCRYPWLAFKNIFSSKLSNKVNELVRMEEINVVFLEEFPVSPNIKRIKNAKVILSLVDSISLRQLRFARTSKSLVKIIYHLFGWIYGSFYEKYFVRHADIVHLVSYEEQHRLEKKLNHSNIKIISVGVESKEVPDTVVKSYDYDLCFSGNLNFYHIQESLAWFLKNVYSDLCQHRQGIKMAVLGSCEYDKAQELQVNNLGVEYFSWVDDYDSILRSAKIVVLPDINGTGIKNRSLNAMAVGNAVVGTSFAFEGIPVKNKNHCIIANDPYEFLQAIEDLLDNSEKRLQIGLAASKFIKDNFDMDHIGEQWVNLLNGMDEVEHN